MVVDSTGDKKKSSKILGLRQIAWWWLPQSMAKQPDKDVWADLPAIQRGFVWNANQIERLWDSITRGFPLGSILLQDSVADSTILAPKNGSEVLDELFPLPDACSRYLILDGQQRATSIALGFKNVWDEDSICNLKQDDWRALWVDIHNESKPKDERQFLFKLTNQAHPWGYASEVEASAHPRRIHARDMREAMVAYKRICTFLNGQELKELKPHEVIPRVAFPWDSRAPVPVAFILELLAEKSKVSNEEIAKSLLDKISRMPFQALNNDVDSERVPSDVKETVQKVQNKFNNIREILENQNQDQAKQFNAIVDGLRLALAETEIPAPVLRSINPAKNNDDSGNENVNDEMDAAFNLFERINTAGTRLTREEINYSMLKSVWPAAAETIPKLLKERWFTHPARLVSLLSRLLLTFPDGYPSVSFKEDDTLRDGLNIAQFRKAIHKESLETQLKTFCSCNQESKCGASQLLESTWALLTKGDWALPSVLAADITQHNEDLMLLLMAWLYRISLTGLTVDDQGKKYALGCITAIHWFALDAPLCAKLLGKELLSCEEENLTMFFHGKLKTLDKADSKKSVMIPLPDVAALGIILESGQSDKDDNKLNSIWDLYFDEPPDEVETWVKSLGNNKSGVNYYQPAHEFLKKVLMDERLVLYAQRKIVDGWFGWFDPTKIARVTDHNAPWDFDHILPWSWVGNERISSSVPKMARIWINSNGNFRAWPAEYNRSKGNYRLIEDELLEYKLKKQDVYDASFIRCPGDWEELSALKGYDDFWGEVKDKELFEKFVKAAIHRTIDIYRYWYDTLEIGKL